jgi:hypothetical protein
MADVNTALADSRLALDELIAACDRCGQAWTTPVAPGKWSPSQNVEHVARALENSAREIGGEPSDFPSFPVFVRPLVRGLFFNRVVKSGRMGKARTNKAMNPERGPATPADGCARLSSAHDAFDRACRAGGAQMNHGIFGRVNISDYARFMAVHTRHHAKQMGH